MGPLICWKPPCNNTLQTALTVDFLDRPSARGFRRLRVSHDPVEETEGFPESTVPLNKRMDLKSWWDPQYDLRGVCVYIYIYIHISCFNFLNQTRYLHLNHLNAYSFIKPYWVPRVRGCWDLVHEATAQHQACVRDPQIPSGIIRGSYKTAPQFIRMRDCREGFLAPPRARMRILQEQTASPRKHKPEAVLKPTLRVMRKPFTRSRLCGSRRRETIALQESYGVPGPCLIPVYFWGSRGAQFRARFSGAEVVPLPSRYMVI